MPNTKTFALLKLIGLIITVSSFYYIFIIFRKLLGNNFDSRLISPNIFFFIILFVIYHLSIILNSYGWKLILEFLGRKKLSFLAVFPIYSKSNIAKYLPGNVFQYAARNFLTLNLDWNQKTIFISNIFEIFLGIIIFLIILSFILLSGTLPNSLANIFTPFYRFTPLLLILGLPILFIYKKQITILLKKFSLKKISSLLLATFLINLLNYLLAGLVLMLIITHTFNYPGSLQLFLSVFSTFSLSYFIGYITPGSPGGIGVREAGLLLTLGPIIGETRTLVAILIHRLITVLTDISTYLIGHFLAYVSRR